MDEQQVLRSAVDEERLQRRLDEFAEIGATDDGGVTRLAYSDTETEAFDHLRAMLPDYLDVWTDSIGNLYASSDPTADQTTLVGSHLDSVFNGGRLDGVLGVVVALEAIQTLEATESEPTRTPTLAVFRGEESVRFNQHTIGSRGALGLLTAADFSHTDQNDIPLWFAMQNQGFQPHDLSEPTLDLDRVDRFFETHIEQGRVLDNANQHLGIVTSIRAPVRFEVTVTGDYDHSGATPMHLRRDALAAASACITAINETASEGDNVVGTVGDITAHDGAINKVCGWVTFPIDIRSHELEPRDRVEEQILAELDRIATEFEVDIEASEVDRSDPVTLSDQPVNELETAAAALNIDTRRIPSGGGHDAMNFQLAGIPTGMLFVPSIDGISHSPKEDTNPESVPLAAAVTAQALR